jgi:hypothetical protein
MSNQRHTHADLIHAWAEGGEIEYFSFSEAIWKSAHHPSNCFAPRFDPTTQYRIKPEVKPNDVWYAEAFLEASGLNFWRCKEHMHNYNLKLTFDGDTGKLLKAEVL